MKWLISIVFVFLSLGSLLAQDVANIEVRGNERLGQRAVLQYVSSQVGKVFDRLQIRDDLKALYNSGLFADIKIDAVESTNGIKLIIRVVEKDFIQQIEFKGNKAVDLEDLEKAVELKIPFLWDETLVRTSLEKVRKVYKEKGFYLVTLRTDILKDGRKKKLVFEIDEGKKVEVKKIYFQGNAVLSDETLKASMFTKEGAFWSFMMGSGRFDEELLAQVDSRRIQLEYLKRGHAFAQVNRPSITFTPDRQSVLVAYHISEGDRYDVGEIRFSGDLDFISDPEALKLKLESQSGKTWNYLKIQKDLQRIQDVYGDEGYAYANVSPNWVVSESDPTKLDLEFNVDKGSIVYFGNIEIHGNFETLDRIIRREILFSEGELFSISKFRESKENLEKLGYFSSVRFVQKDILEEKRMDVIVEVEEKQTGSLTLGASFSSFDRFGIQGSVSKINLFGRGYDMNLSALFSGKRQLFQLMFRNPRINDTHLSMTVNAFNTEFESIDETSITERGGNITFGYPIKKHWSVSGTYGLRNVDINIQEIIDSLYPDSVGLNSSLGASLIRDTLNTREVFQPYKGSMNKFSGTVASKFVGSNLSYLKLDYVGKKYLQVFDEESFIFPASVLSFGLRANYIKGIEGRSTPYNERFIPGGIYSIRGHLFRSLGPFLEVPFNITGRRDDDLELGVTGPRKLHLGGNKQIIANIEYLFDIFKEAKIKGLLFFDGGNAFPEGKLNIEDLRFSAGFGFRWFSPLGPLRFEWGIPLDRKPGEERILFDFSVGSPF